jgi:sulfur carrier protein
MPRLIINGETDNNAPTNIAALLHAQKIPEAQWSSIALAKNGTVIPRHEWPNIMFAEGDRVEIVKPFVGG